MVSILWFYGCMAAAGLAVVGLGLALWGRRENRRSEALDILAKIGPWGIEPLNRILKAYAIGNYLGKDSITRVFHEMIDDLKGNGLDKMLTRLGWKMVDQFIKDPDTLKTLKDKIAGKVIAKVEAPAETVAVQ